MADPGTSIVTLPILAANWGLIRRIVSHLKSDRCRTAL